MAFPPILQNGQKFPPRSGWVKTPEICRRGFCKHRLTDVCVLTDNLLCIDVAVARLGPYISK